MLQRFVEIYAQNAPLFLLLVTWDDYVELLHLSLSTWRQWAAFVCLKVYQTTSLISAVPRNSFTLAQ